MADCRGRVQPVPLKVLYRLRPLPVFARQALPLPGEACLNRPDNAALSLGLSSLFATVLPTFRMGVRRPACLTAARTTDPSRATRIHMTAVAGSTTIGR